MGFPKGLEGSPRGVNTSHRLKMGNCFLFNLKQERFTLLDHPRDVTILSHRLKSGFSCLPLMIESTDFGVAIFG